MATMALRVLVDHQDAAVRRRLHQSLSGEPDILLLDHQANADQLGLAEQVRRWQPDILLTDGHGDALTNRQLLTVLHASQTPTRVVLLNGAGRLDETAIIPIAHHLSEQANQAEILRGIRQVQSPSRYLDYLPAIFHRNDVNGQPVDDFVGRFLRIFESINEPIDRQIDGLAHYLDLDLTNDDFLPWLGSWLSVVVNNRWPRERQVALLRAAPELHRWRGTRRGLREHLRLYLGLEIDPEIDETAGGMRLGGTTQLGQGTILGVGGPRHHFTVTLRLSDANEVDQAAIVALIDAQKPAHCTYDLVVLPSESSLPATADSPSPRPL